MYVRRRPTLPQPLGCSTIGAERLNFRVRYGTGCFPFAMAAVTLAEHTHPFTTVVVWGCSKLVMMHVVQLCVQLLVFATLTHEGCVGWELHVDAGVAL